MHFYNNCIFFKRLIVILSHLHDRFYVAGFLKGIRIKSMIVERFCSKLYLPSCWPFHENHWLTNKARVGFHEAVFSVSDLFHRKLFF